MNASGSQVEKFSVQDGSAENLALRHALETAGVEFIDENRGGPGVRLRKHEKVKSRK
jgi:hypothetical protein